MGDDNQIGNVKAPQQAASSRMMDRKRAVEIAVLTVLLVVVWGLLVLPIVFFHLPVETESAASNTTVVNSSNVECFPYPTTTLGSGGVCQTELTDTLLSLNCDTGETPLVLRDAESSANELLPLLNFLNPSPACREAVVPFLCVFLFGLCDSSGVSIQPTSTQCEKIRDVLCPDEFALASEFVELPDCKIFPAEEIFCLDSSGSGSGLSSSAMDVDIDILQNSTITLLECSENFFREEENGSCVPNCLSWTAAFVDDTDAVLLVSMIIGFIGGIVVIFISCIRFKRMFTFPSIILIFTTIDVMIPEFLVFVNFIDRPYLYCTSMNLIDSLLESTIFCAISGMIFMYVVLQLVLWWFFHTTLLFWKIFFTIHAHTYEASNKIRYVKIAVFTVSLVVPLIAILVPMADFAVDVKSDALLQSRNITFISGGLGFRFIRFPPQLCTGRDSNAVYYSTVLPVNILMFVGITEMVLIFYSIHKRRGKNDRLGTAERKILIVLCYYVIVTIFTLVSFTLATRNSSAFAEALLDFFTCERPGHDPKAPCDQSSFRRLAFQEISTLSTILLVLLPVVNLLYAVNVMEIKATCGMLCRKKGEKNKMHGSGNNNAIGNNS